MSVEYPNERCFKVDCTGEREPVDLTHLLKPVAERALSMYMADFDVSAHDIEKSWNRGRIITGEEMPHPFYLRYPVSKEASWRRRYVTDILKQAKDGQMTDLDVCADSLRWYMAYVYGRYNPENDKPIESVTPANFMYYEFSDHIGRRRRAVAYAESLGFEDPRTQSPRGLFRSNGITIESYAALAILKQEEWSKESPERIETVLSSEKPRALLRSKPDGRKTMTKKSHHPHAITFDYATSSVYQRPRTAQCVGDPHSHFSYWEIPDHGLHRPAVILD